MTAPAGPGRRPSGSARWANRPGAADRGSVTVLVVFVTLIALALASLLVDVGTALGARERSADIAEQAARAGANDIDIAALRTGRVAIDTRGACGRALSLVVAYSARSGFHATAACPAVSPNHITIIVWVTTRPVIAAALGSFTVHATATAEPVCGITRGGQC